MLSKSSYTYILIGLYIRYLRHIESEPQKQNIIEGINSLKQYLEAVEFTVSLSGFWKLEQFKKSLEETISTNSVLSDEECIKLRDLISTIESIVFAEAETKSIYVIENRRYNSDYLMKSPEKIFKKGVFDKLSKFCQRDIVNANLSLVFGLSTATAFHILRATEEVVRQYYKHHIKKNRPKVLLWKQMLDDLQNKKSKKPLKLTIDNLNLIRENYRNPTNHPEIFYDIESAQDIYGLCVDVINKMISEISPE